MVDNLGSTITITPLTITKDKWGDKTESEGTPVVTVGLPYDIFSEKYNFQTAGDLDEGDTVVIVKYDETVATQSNDIRYKLTFDSQDYDITSIEDYDISGITLAKQIMCKKRI